MFQYNKYINNRKIGIRIRTLNKRIKEGETGLDNEKNKLTNLYKQSRRSVIVFPDNDKLIQYYKDALIFNTTDSNLDYEINEKTSDMEEELKAYEAGERNIEEKEKKERERVYNNIINQSGRKITNLNNNIETCLTGKIINKIEI